MDKKTKIVGEKAVSHTTSAHYDILTSHDNSLQCVKLSPCQLIMIRYGHNSIIDNILLPCSTEDLPDKYDSEIDEIYTYTTNVKLLMPSITCLSDTSTSLALE